jgi:hypothetical protein
VLPVALEVFQEVFECDLVVQGREGAGPMEGEEAPRPPC